MKKNQLKADEMLEIISYQWATTEDIRKLGSIGINSAQKVSKEIKTQLENEGYRLPRNLVPMKKVVEYFKIDISYLKKVSKKELA